MADHIRIVAILHIVLGSLSVLGGLAIFAVMGGLAAVIGVTGTADGVPAVPLVGAWVVSFSWCFWSWACRASSPERGC